MTTFNGPTQWTPSGKIVHEQEIMRKYMPTFQRLYSLKHMLPIDDQQYIEAQSQKFQETGMLPNGPRFYEYACARLEWISMKQSKSKNDLK